MSEHAKTKLQILSANYIQVYQKSLVFDLSTAFAALSIKHQIPAFYISTAAAYSSMIEGEPIEVDSYIKSQMKPGIFKKNYTKKTDDLLAAYQFAKKNPLDFKNILKAHKLLSAHFLRKTARGKIRHGMEFILDKDDKIVYVAASPNIVKWETEKLFDDIQLLLSEELNVQESFYFAAIIHLVFLKIHPFEDGNGRTARLLEKWFLAENMGKKAWSVQSEKYYYKHLSDYYKNLHIGMDYEGLDFDKCLSLLQMLVGSLRKEN